MLYPKSFSKSRGLPMVSFNVFGGFFLLQTFSRPWQVVTELQAPLLTRSSVRTMTGALGGAMLSVELPTVVSKSHMSSIICRYFIDIYCRLIIAFIAIVFWWFHFFCVCVCLFASLLETVIIDDCRFCLPRRVRGANCQVNGQSTVGGNPVQTLSQAFWVAAGGFPSSWIRRGYLGMPNEIL